MDYPLELIPLLIAIVEALKLFGVKGNWSALVGIVLGIGVSFGLDYVPEITQQIIQALMLGLAVPGFYTLAKRAGTAIVNGRDG